MPIATRVLARAEDMVTLSGGRTLPARHYSLVGKVALDDWYDAAPLWTALRTQARDGFMTEYRRTV
jgi:hypothetical protein